jgi:hypothetical protein
VGCADTSALSKQRHAAALRKKAARAEAKIDMEIRKAAEGDIPHLLPLMRELAEFEKYVADFAVTGAVLREQGFLRSRPIFIVSLLKPAVIWLDFWFTILFRILIGRSRT